MRRYETIYIIRPTANEEEITSIIDRTSGIVENFDGTVVTLDRWGLKKLAYQIKKETQGYYVYCEYAGVPEAVDEIERQFRIDETVMKYMTVKTQDVYVADAPKPEVEETEEGAEATDETTETKEVAEVADETKTETKAVETE